MIDILQHVDMLVRKAGKRVMEIYETDFDVIRKTDGSPVTAADMAVHEILMKGLAEYEWPILSEESKADDNRLGAKRVWIVDPIDGTGGFVKKRGDFAIQVGLVVDGEPVLGVVYQPTEDRYYYAQKSQGAFVVERSGLQRKLYASDISAPEEATLAASASHFDQATKEKVAEFGIKQTYHIGGIGNKIALIAERDADVYATATNMLGEWDICAPQIILEEAGGIMTGLHGEKITYNNPDPHNPHGILAAAKSLHPVILKKLKAVS
jgi:3'(2'), 5'-bisphosphate nucleotidase